MNVRIFMGSLAISFGLHEVGGTWIPVTSWIWVALGVWAIWEGARAKP